MIIIGADYHPGFQQIAFVDTDTGEFQERRLQHREEAEKFYRDLAAQGMQVRVGMWSYATGDGIQASFAVTNGVVYVASADGNVYALDANSGVMKWKYPAGVYTSSPAVANGIIYVGSDDDNVYALNASTGKELWSYDTGGFISYASPTVANGILYIGSDSGTVYAFGLPNGSIARRVFQTPRAEDASARLQFQGTLSESDTIRPGTPRLTGYRSQPDHSTFENWLGR
jgi:outer membrane protein assembly factor BamB